eukprot:173083-Chlamydomonas_euryale.AAC.1
MTNGAHLKVAANLSCRVLLCLAFKLDLRPWRIRGHHTACYEDRDVVCADASHVLGLGAGWHVQCNMRAVFGCLVQGVKTQLVESRDMVYSGSIA